MANSALTLGTASKFLAQDHTIQNVYNTTAEVTIATITVPAGLIKAGDRIRVKFLTSTIQNAIAVSYYYRLRFGGTVPLTATITTQMSPGNREVIETVYELEFLAVNDVVCYGHILQSQAGASIGGGDLSSFTSSLYQYQGLCRVTSDFSGGSVITVTIQPNQLRADSDHQIWGWTAEHITT